MKCKSLANCNFFQPLVIVFHVLASAILEAGRIFEPNKWDEDVAVDFGDTQLQTLIDRLSDKNIHGMQYTELVRLSVLFSLNAYGYDYLCAWLVLGECKRNLSGMDSPEIKD